MRAGIESHSELMTQRERHTKRNDRLARSQQHRTSKKKCFMSSLMSASSMQRQMKKASHGRKEQERTPGSTWALLNLTVQSQDSSRGKCQTDVIIIYTSEPVKAIHKVSTQPKSASLGLPGLICQSIPLQWYPCFVLECMFNQFCKPSDQVYNESFNLYLLTDSCLLIAPCTAKGDPSDIITGSLQHNMGVIIMSAGTRSQACKAWVKNLAQNHQVCLLLTASTGYHTIPGTKRSHHCELKSTPNFVNQSLNHSYMNALQGKIRQQLHRISEKRETIDLLRNSANFVL